MSGARTERTRKAIPAWLVPWLIPLLLVLFVVSTVNPFLMVAMALVVVLVAGRWRYLEVRKREVQGAHEWERWRTDAVLRRAADKYNKRR